MLAVVIVVVVVVAVVVDYIGIKNQMNLALKQYSEGDKDNFEDIAESIIIVRNHLDLLAKLFHTFDSSEYFSGTTIQQLNTLNLAAEYVQQSKEFENPKNILNIPVRISPKAITNRGFDLSDKTPLTNLLIP